VDPSGEVDPLGTSGEVVAPESSDVVPGCPPGDAGAGDGVGLVAAPADPVGAGAGAVLVPAFDSAVPPPPVVSGRGAAAEVGLLEARRSAWGRARREADCRPTGRLENARATSGSPMVGEPTTGTASLWSAPGSVSWGSGAKPIRPTASATSHAVKSRPSVVAANRTAWMRRRPAARKTGSSSVEGVGSSIYWPNPISSAGARCFLFAGPSISPGDAASRNRQHRANVPHMGKGSRPMGGSARRSQTIAWMGARRCGGSSRVPVGERCRVPLMKDLKSRSSSDGRFKCDRACQAGDGPQRRS